MPSPKETSTIHVYWDKSDPADPGWAWRLYEDELLIDSGPVAGVSAFCRRPSADLIRRSVGSKRSKGVEIVFI